MKRLLAIGLAAVAACNSFADWLFSGSTLTECDSSGTPLAEGG